MKTIIHRPETPSKENLRKVYDVFNKIFKEQELFYNSEEVKTLKKDKTNIFL